MKSVKFLAGAVAALALTTTSAFAETRVTYKSAKSTSSYYQMAVQIAEAMKAGSDIIVTVEESQGSVQNVMEVKARGGDYVFTTPPALVPGSTALPIWKVKPCFWARARSGPRKARNTSTSSALKARSPWPRSNCPTRFRP